MEFIGNWLQSGQLVYFDYLGLAIGLMLLAFPHKLKKIWNWVLCIYSGGIAGVILGILFFENLQGTLAGCAVGIAVSVAISYAIEAGHLFIVSSFVFSKLVFAGIMLCADDCSFAMFFTGIVLCLILGFMVSRLYGKMELTIWFYVILGVLETSANLIAIFKYNSLVMGKSLYDETGMVRFFLYLLKADFSLWNYQWNFIFLILIFGLIEIVYLKILGIGFVNRGNRNGLG